MPSFLYAFIFIYVFLLGYYMVYKKHASFIVYSVVKMSMSTIFVGLGLYALFTHEITVGAVLIACSLLFAWVGDFYLRYLGRDAKKFNVGITAFAVCQLLLIAVFFMNFSFSPVLIAVVCITIAFTALFWILLKKVHANLGISLPFIKTYMLTMSILFAFSIVNLVFSHDLTAASMLLGTGAIMFFVSDVFLGVYSYISKRRLFTAVNSMLYFGGMLLIALSLFY